MKFLKTVLHYFYLLLVPVPIAFFGAALIAMFSLFTGFRAKSIVMSCLVAPLCRLLLWTVGVSVQGRVVPSREPCIYTCNHVSAFDIFAVTALGLPKTRYFMSVSTLKILPVAIVGRCTGVIYVPEQSDTEARRVTFAQASQNLARLETSALLTPEGRRNEGHEIQKFNRGSFHLALSLQRPIECLYVHTPKQCHPGKTGVLAGRGAIEIYNLGRVETTRWKLENLEQHIADVRRLYIDERARRRAEEEAMEANANAPAFA